MSLSFCKISTQYGNFRQMQIRGLSRLTHFTPLVSFFTYWKHRKTFLGGIEKSQRYEMDLGLFINWIKLKHIFSQFF